MRSDFVAFILSHGRANRVHTYKALRKHGYTGDIRIIIDDEDEQAEQYFALYGDEVVQFSRREVNVDLGDNNPSRHALNIARTATFDIAKRLGYKYFVQLDDDYTAFLYKRDENLMHLTRSHHVESFDDLINAMIEFLECDKRILTVAIAQSGDFVGGALMATTKREFTLWRKAMNFFICSTERPFQFLSRLNEDIVTYTRLGHVGWLFFTTPQVELKQIRTQINPGGLTEAYHQFGTYVKSFYPILYVPSAIKIGVLTGEANSRVHTKVMWQYCVPQIISSRYKKSKTASAR